MARLELCPSCKTWVCFNCDDRVCPNCGYVYEEEEEPKRDVRGP